jgi:outer membrane receptor for ferrienterochelin and colicins
MKRSVDTIGRSIVIVALLLATAVTMNAQEKKLEDLSLEDLLNVSVVTASKTAEKSSDAPAVISVVTSKDIELLGARSIGEVLDRVAGLYLMSSPATPNNMLVIRGGATELYNTQILVLIDGRPARESFHSGNPSNFFLGTPLSRVERIEVVRGPGSVLYGTGAYLGVINIITKSMDESPLRITSSYGSFNTAQAELTGGAKIGDVGVSGAIRVVDSKGWPFTARGEADAVRNKANTADSLLRDPKTVNYFEKTIGASFKATYKSFTLDSYYGRVRQEDMWRQPTWQTPIDYGYGTDHFFADAGYSHDISSLWTTSLNVTYNQFQYLFYTPLDYYQDDHARRNSSDVVVEWTNYFKPANDLNVVFGALANNQTGSGVQPDLKLDGLTTFKIDSAANPNPFIVVPAYNQTSFTAYVQADYVPVWFLKVIAGGQFNKVPQLDADFVPRLGGIVTVSDQLSAKILYGQAFRSPSTYERVCQSPPSIYGNANLKPEKVGTFETQVSYISNRFQATITYFNSVQTNQITRSLTSDSLLIIIYGGKKVSVPIYVNRGELTMKGIEFESKVVLSKELSLFGSVSTQTNEDQNGKTDLYGTPKLMAKFGVEYASSFGLNVGVFNSYIGTGGDITSYDSKGNQVTRYANPAAKAYNYLSANVSYDISRAMGLDRFPGIMLNIYADNLLNEQVYYPEYARRNINSIPGRSGSALYGGLSVRF